MKKLTYFIVFKTRGTSMSARTPPLFGFLALEAMDLIANPISQQIEGNPKHDGKMMISLY